MKKIKPRRIFWTSFGQIDSVTLCLTDKLYEKECIKFGYNNIIVKDGVCTRFTQEGKRGECIIGISDKVKHDYVTYVALIAHEITHAVDFIMEEDNMSDMEFRAYAVQDMLAKAMMYIEDIGMFKNKSYKKSKETKYGNSMEINIQEKYEEVLSAHWHKLHQIKELVDSDSGSELRARSISDRRNELALIVSRKNALEYVFDDCELVEPEWYTDWIDRLNKYEDPFYRH